MASYQHYYAKISIQKTVISSHSSNSNIDIYLYNAVECT